MPLNSSIAFRIPSLTVSFVWTLVGSLIGAAAQWGMLILFAKLGNTAMVGRYAFALAVAYPLSLVANLNLRVVFVNDLEGRYPFAQMLGSRYLLISAAAATLLLICGLRHASQQDNVILLLVGIAFLVDSVSESYYSILQKYERMDRIARSLILRSCLGFAAAATAVYVTKSLVYAVCGLFIGRALTLVLYDASAETFRIGALYSGGTEVLPDPTKAVQRFRPVWHLKAQVGMLWIALPLGIVSVLVSLNGNMPRYVIEKYLGPHDLGIYSALNYVPQAAGIIAITLGNVAFARLAKMFFARDIQAFKALLTKIIGICILLGGFALVVSTIAGKQILTILYKPEYAQHTGLLIWLTGAGAVACVAGCLGCAMTAASEFRLQVPLFAVVLSVSFAATLLLVPHFGLYGAAIATLVSLTVQVIGAYVILNRSLARRANAPRSFESRTEPEFAADLG